jgi:DNA polymerase I
MTDQRPRLFLIDGSWYIFRAFFAIPPLSNASGLPTNKADVPIQIDADDLRARGPDLEKVRMLFNELGFVNLLKILEFNQAA